MLRGGFIGETWSKKGGRTAMLDPRFVVEDVFRAAIATTLNPELRQELEQCPIPVLYERAFRSLEISNVIYSDLQVAQLETMRGPLIDLVAFQPWEEKLSDYDAGASEQYDSLESVEQALSEARVRFAASPLVVRAAEAVAARWMATQADE
jgi:hypothetical protein